ncbi:MAG: hypothetical protein A2X08_04320 [Bacteroidetes bacterium GWA2_32_17]|nr:MAG: hypothetical protein A2X08_04320 [Bacteroidetes bacterium GWA2_32_17]
MIKYLTFILIILSAFFASSQSIDRISFEFNGRYKYNNEQIKTIDGISSTIKSNSVNCDFATVFNLFKYAQLGASYGLQFQYLNSTLNSRSPYSQYTHNTGLFLRLGLKDSSNFYYLGIGINKPFYKSSYSTSTFYTEVHRTVVSGELGCNFYLSKKWYFNIGVWFGKATDILNYSLGFTGNLKKDVWSLKTGIGYKFLKK